MIDGKILGYDSLLKLYLGRIPGVIVLSNYCNKHTAIIRVTDTIPEVAPIFQIVSRFNFLNYFHDIECSLKLKQREGRETEYEISIETSPERTCYSSAYIRLKDLIISFCAVDFTDVLVKSNYYVAPVSCELRVEEVSIYVTDDKSLAYEARKGATRNMADEKGRQSLSGIKFCQQVSERMDCDVTECLDVSLNWYTEIFIDDLKSRGVTVYTCLGLS